MIEQVDIRTIAASPLAYDVKLEHVESFFTEFAKVSTALSSSFVVFCWQYCDCFTLQLIVLVISDLVKFKCWVK